MKLKVPFQKGLKKWKNKGWCGPITLASILRYYKVPYKIEDIVKYTGYKTGISPKALAYYCLSKNMNVIYINKYSKPEEEMKEVSARLRKFLKNVKSQEQNKKFQKKLEKSSKYKFVRKEPNIKDLEKYIKQYKPILIHLNIARIYKKKDLWPHFITVVGFDKNNIYIHNIYPKNTAYEKVPKELFKKAWNLDNWNKEALIPFKNDQL
jgi:hypothetical protein